jgi:AraC-like DNA-binding protein
LGAAGWLGKPFTSEILVRAILAAQDAALLWPVLPSPTPSVNRFESPAAILAQAAREALFTGTNEPENLLAQADVARAVRYNAAELASFCELSSSTLHRLCLSHFRASPGRWLESLQIQEVARLLPCADLLREIAAQVGFNHQSSLARFVHRRLGLNPSALARTLAAETKGIAEEPRNRLA